MNELPTSTERCTSSIKGDQKSGAAVAEALDRDPKQKKVIGSAVTLRKMQPMRATPTLRKLGRDLSGHSESMESDKKREKTRLKE